MLVSLVTDTEQVGAGGTQATSRTGLAKAELPPVEAGGPTPKTTEEGELRAQVGDDAAPSQTSGPGGGKSLEGKGEKRNGQQAELEQPQTAGGGKKIKRPGGSSIRPPELSPKRNDSKQIRKTGEVEENSTSGMSITLRCINCPKNNEHEETSRTSVEGHSYNHICSKEGVLKVDKDTTYDDVLEFMLSDLPERRVLQAQVKNEPRDLTYQHKKIDLARNEGSSGTRARL